ncbi:MAG: hypothetical protein ACFFD4_25190 [Candidatus Odinarchaeota archaeon]
MSNKEEMTKIRSTFSNFSTEQLLLKPSEFAIKISEPLQNTSIESNKKVIEEEVKKFEDRIPKIVKEAKKWREGLLPFITIVLGCLVLILGAMNEQDRLYLLITGLGITSSGVIPSWKDILAMFFGESDIKDILVKYVKRVREYIEVLEGRKPTQETHNLWIKLASTAHQMNITFNNTEELLEYIDKILDVMRTEIYK